MSVYNIEETTADQCLCCNVKLSDPNSKKQHFKSKKHHTKWAQYFAEPPWYVWCLLTQCFFSVN